ncbi:hypothetical protein HY945_00670 [Candidatus Gottesmanbacteria bacterium]|nr:hypothetical protein [Candidatus Gottesmanbacteria bacterium]
MGYEDWFGSTRFHGSLLAFVIIKSTLSGRIKLSYSVLTGRGRYVIVVLTDLK